MSDMMRTALKGGGQITISIERWANGDFDLCVSEYWARLTSIERAAISAAELDAAEDPDGLLREELTRLVQKAHMNWEAHRKESANE